MEQELKKSEDLLLQLSESRALSPGCWEGECPENSSNRVWRQKPKNSEDLLLQLSASYAPSPG